MAKSQGFTTAQAFRDIFVAAINKGQLPILGCIFLAGLIIFKMPPDKVWLLADEIWKDVENLEIVGYILFLGTVYAWYRHSRIMRQTTTIELQRIGSTKSDLQNRLASGGFQSSEEK